MKKIPYLHEFNYFRGGAIFFIVLGHSFLLFGMNEAYFLKNDPWYLYRWIFSIVEGGTALFVFISGFLFYYIFFQRGFQYEQFMKKKPANVLCPYIILVGLFILLRVGHKMLYGLPYWDGLECFFADTFFFWAFWYIPFIMVIFLISPVYIWFIHQKYMYQCGIVCMNLCIAVILGRNNMNPIQSVVYFSPCYCLGIICAQNYKQLINVNRFYKVILLIIYGAFSYWGIHNDQYIAYGKAFLESVYPLDSVILQKMILCLLCVWLFQFFKKLQCKALQKGIAILAEYSFSIFFLHNYLVRCIMKLNS